MAMVLRSSLVTKGPIQFLKVQLEIIFFMFAFSRFIVVSDASIYNTLCVSTPTHTHVLHRSNKMNLFIDSYIIQARSFHSQLTSKITFEKKI